MSIHLRRFIGKIFILSTLLGILFSIWTHFYVNGFQKIVNIQEENNQSNSAKFIKSNNADMAMISVAITTNIWTNHKLLNTLPASIYKDVLSIEEAMFDKQTATDEIIGKNMIAVQEYRNVLTTSIKNLLENALNKQEVLEAYIYQLEFRYEAAVTNQKNLIKQKELFSLAMVEANAEIVNIKEKISTDFNANDSQASIENIDSYLEEKKKYYFARTYIIYINQFLREYQYLNEYNKILLDVLINNKEAIIKDAQLVIPNNGWIESLKALDLLFEEADFKSQ